MFDLFSWSHIVILLTAALIIVGPKDLPRLMHMAGKWAGKARGMANEFRRSFDEMARQSELDELRKEIESLKKTATDTHSDFQQAVSDIPHGISADAAPVEPLAEPRSGEFQVTTEQVTAEHVTAEHVTTEHVATEAGAEHLSEPAPQQTTVTP